MPIRQQISRQLVAAAVRLRSHSGDAWGTGFGFARPDDYTSANPASHSPDDAHPWRFWYVTCAHVLDAIEASAAGGDKRVHLEVNETAAGGGGITTISYPIDHFWSRHPAWTERCTRLGPIASRLYTPADAAVDVAVTTAPTHYQDWDKLDWGAFPPRLHLTKALLAAAQDTGSLLSEGDDLFLFGFPVGFYGDAKNWPTVRRGMVAQIQPYLQGNAQTFLIDGSVFGGNSGGPVVTQINTRLNTHSLVGMASGCRLDPRTGENADLGIVVPLDTINETVEAALRNSAHVSAARRGDGQ